MVSLSRTFDAGKTAVNALRDASVTIAHGEVACMMGKSGAGKRRFGGSSAGTVAAASKRCRLGRFPSGSARCSAGLALAASASVAALRHRLRLLRLLVDRRLDPEPGDVERRQEPKSPEWPLRYTVVTSRIDRQTKGLAEARPNLLKPAVGSCGAL